MSVVLILLGIALLYAGGEVLVKYAVKLAKSLNVSSLVIGLTVVAFGTSMPELCAVLVAAFKGIPEMALGSIVGSNIANIGLIIGVSAIIYPLAAKMAFIRREVPIMIAAVASLFIIGWNDYMGRVEGLILLAALAGYVWIVARQNKLPIPVEEDTGPLVHPALSILGVAAGVALLVGGAHSLVTGAEIIARYFGVPDKVIGLTLVALGTSLPELASCSVAAYRQQSDFILGNVIGSNIFNSLAIMGTAILVYPITTPFADFMLDFLVMMAFCLLIFPFLYTGLLIRRWEGGALLLLYLIYVYYLYSSGPPPVVAPAG